MANIFKLKYQHLFVLVIYVNWFAFKWICTIIDSVIINENLRIKHS